MGLESTIIAVAEDGLLRLLRPGPIDLGLALTNADIIEAPGQLASHYAPTKPMRLNAETATAGEWHIGFGAVSGDENLSNNGNLAEAAFNLFAALHRADASDQLAIAVAPIPTEGIGIAINDRLQRAAAR